MYKFGEIESIKVEDYNKAEDEIVEIFRKYNNKQNKKTIIVFELDHVLFTQKDLYVKEPVISYKNISNIGLIQKILCKTIKEHAPDTYFIGITNKVISNKETEEVICNNFILDLLISRNHKNKINKHDLQTQQIKMISKLAKEYGFNMNMAFVNNKHLEINCMKYFLFTPNIHIYMNNSILLVLITTLFIKNYRSPKPENIIH